MEIWLGVGLHALCPEQKCARKYLATIPVAIYISYLAIYCFLTLSNLKMGIKSRSNPHFL